jgi:hypothetical protein
MTKLMIPRLLVIGAALMACSALPITPLTGFELLSMELGEYELPLIRDQNGITGGASKMTCQTLVDAEATLPNSGAEMRLLLPVRQDKLSPSLVRLNTFTLLLLCRP